MLDSDFVHLHVHGQHSLLDGLTRPEQAMAAAEADGQHAQALTEHGSLGGMLKAAKAAAKHGVKLIPGMEMYLSIGDRHEQNHVMIPREDDFDGSGGDEGADRGMKRKSYEHLTVLATSKVGWRNLQLIDNASHDSFWGKPRCLLPGTKIHTIQGVKNVEDVRVGDLVLTHKGRFRRVTELMVNHHDGPVLGIELGARYPSVTWVTPEHPVLIRKTGGTTAWTEAQHIAPGRQSTRKTTANWRSFVCLPKFRGGNLQAIDTDSVIGDVWVRDGERVTKTIARVSMGSTYCHRSFPSEIALTFDFGYFTGLYLAEGAVNRDQEVTFSLHADEVELHRVVDRFALDLAGKPAVVDSRPSRPEYRGVDLRIYSAPLALMLSRMFGSGAANKGLPGWLLAEANPEFLRGVYEGVLAGDGSDFVGARRLEQTSENLAWQMRLLGAFVSESFACVTADDDNDPDHAVRYRSNFTDKPESRKYRKTLSDEAYVYKPVSQIQTRHYDGPVYNFEVDGDHSYVGEFAMHNCDYALLAEHSAGLVVGTGCLGGPVAGQLLIGDEEQADANLARLVDIFGADRVFVEVMDHGIAAEHRVIPGLVRLASKFDLPVVATNDAHYAGACDAQAHDAWLAISASKGTKRVLVSDENRFRFNGSGYHLRTSAEMHALFDGQPGTEMAVVNSLLFADMVEDNIVLGSIPEHHLLPTFPVPDGFASTGAYFHEQVRQGLIARYGSPLPAAVRERARHEEQVIREFGVVDYYLVIADMIAGERAAGGLVGAGRGSGAGSICAYALGITNIDPIENGLLFERFLNPTRKGLPDFDTDFQASRQMEAFRRAASIYGADKVARIGTYGNAWAKDALKKMGRVLGKEETAGRLAAAIPNGDAKKWPLTLLLDPDVPTGAELRQKIAEGGPEAAELVELAKAVEGTPSQDTVHACGIIISPEPLPGAIPLRRDRRNDNFPVTQWDAADSEAAKYVKFDFLAIKDLDVVANALELIEASTGETVDIMSLRPDADDDRAKATRAMLAAGRTAGVFQLAGKGITELTMQIQPENHHDLSAILALYRPGPMGADMHKQYARRRRGGELVDYGVYTRIPAEQDVVKSVLDRTLGSMCLAKGERVYSVTRGAMVPVEDVTVGELVQGVDADGQHRVAPVTWSGRTGHKPVFRLNLAGGFSVRLTDNHPVYTARGWVEVKDLRADDVIASPHKLIGGDALPSPRADVAEARVLGSLLGDGSITQRVAPTFVNSEPRLAVSFLEAVGARFPGCSVGVPRTNHHGVPAYPVVTGVARGGANGTAAGPVLSWLRDAGLTDSTSVGVHSRSKFIPTQWLSRTDEAAVELIAALWDCDGRVKAEAPNRGASYQTISSRLADDIRFMLLRLGVSTVITACPYTNPSGTSEVAFNVAVADPRTFARIVGPRLQHPQKRAAAEALAGLQVANLRDKRGSLVPSTVVRNLVRAESGQSLKRAGQMIGTAGMIGQGDMVGGGTIAALAEKFHTPGLSRLAASRWLPIISIEPDGITDVYDLTVEHLHSFVAEGVVVHNCYQEQLMQLAQVVADFAPGQMSDLQKAFSKKDKELMDPLREVWIERGQLAARADGTPKVAFRRDTLEGMWTTFEASSSYLFNASHSYAYAMLTWQTAYLKANWPAHFGAALLACTTKAEKRQQVLADLIAEGIDVRPPSVNESAASTSASAEGAILFGLAEIKDVGDAGRTIIAERDSNGPFGSVADLVERTRITSIVVQALAEAGALDEFGPRLGICMAARALRVPGITVPAMEWGVQERSARQRARLGVPVGEHPMTALHSRIKSWKSKYRADTAFFQVHNLPERDVDELNVIGVVCSAEERFGRSGKRLLMQLESATARVEVMMWPNRYSVWRTAGNPLPYPGQIVAVSGRLKAVQMSPAATLSDEADDDEIAVEAAEDEPIERPSETILNLVADRIDPVLVDDQVQRLAGPGAASKLTVAIAPEPEQLRRSASPKAAGDAVPAALPGDEPDEAAVVLAGSDNLIHHLPLFKVANGAAVRTFALHGFRPPHQRIVSGLYSNVDQFKQWWSSADIGDRFTLTPYSSEVPQLAIVAAESAHGDLSNRETEDALMRLLIAARTAAKNQGSVSKVHAA